VVKSGQSLAAPSHSFCNWSRVDGLPVRNAPSISPLVGALRWASMGTSQKTENKAR
jgi:hypothetical protein